MSSIRRDHKIPASCDLRIELFMFYANGFYDDYDLYNTDWVWLMDGEGNGWLMKNNSETLVVFCLYFEARTQTIFQQFISFHLSVQ